MKRITIGFLLLVVMATAAKAQDFKKVRSALLLSQVGKSDPAKLEAVKSELDKVIADPKAENNVETHLLKAEILGSISGDSSLKEKYPHADVEAFEALKKYFSLDPSGEKLKADNYLGINGISQSFFRNAGKYFDAKNWDSAYARFALAAEFSDLLVAKKMTTSAFDTTTYLYTGIAAQNAKKEDEAAKYYSKLADLKVKGPNYEHIYVFLPTYYANKKDENNFKKYLALGKEVYPEKTYWSELEFEGLTNNLSLPELIKKFEADSAANKINLDQYMNYGNLFSNDKRIKDLSEAERVPYTLKALSAFTQAANLDSSNALNNYNVGVTLYSLWSRSVDSARAIKGVTPAIKAKRAQADKIADAGADKTIDWLEKAYKQISVKTDKDRVSTNVEKSSAKLLSNLYEYKRERSKGGKPADYDKFDAKFKFYDTKY